MILALQERQLQKIDLKCDYVVRNTFIDGYAGDDTENFSNAGSRKASSDPTSSRSSSVSVERCPRDNFESSWRADQMPTILGASSDHVQQRNVPLSLPHDVREVKT